jgi:hypothetical protein
VVTGWLQFLLTGARLGSVVIVEFAPPVLTLVDLDKKAKIGAGFLITTYPTDAIKEGTKIWPK